MGRECKVDSQCRTAESPHAVQAGEYAGAERVGEYRIDADADSASIMLAGHILETSMILGVATIPSYRKRGCMHELMNDVLDEVEHRELVTLIQAYNPSMYTQFGFEMVYYRRRYTVHRPPDSALQQRGLNL